MIELALKYWKPLAFAAFCIAVFLAGYRAGASGVRSDWDAERTETAKAVLAASEAARTREQNWNLKLQEATNEARKREMELKAAVSAANAAHRGLRDDLARLRRNLPASSLAACRDTADAALAVFGDCADRYLEMARNTDELVIERDALIAAWPSNTGETK
ncbi:MAG: DUF2514 domain-containing protein [Zoogloeaceae bacterium]|jgi:hypothetical protein|nr:DUF2514 domain-containing protein [Zoogloeaceae bacterium]